MSRTIKFRAWNPDKKMFGYVVLPPRQVQVPTQDIFPRSSFGADYISFQNIEDWQQFTGFLDRNDKEVYEGDIVEVYEPNRCCPCGDWTECEFKDQEKCEDHDTHQHDPVLGCENHLCRQEVKWRQGYFCTEDNGDYCPSLGDDEIEVEIIGNIYENSDLLCSSS